VQSLRIHVVILSGPKDVLLGSKFSRIHLISLLVKLILSVSGSWFSGKVGMSQIKIAHYTVFALSIDEAILPCRRRVVKLE